MTHQRGPCSPGRFSLPSAFSSYRFLLLALLAVALGPKPTTGDIVERWLVIGNMTLNPTCISPRVSVVVNNSWPGPTITANDGDTLVIHVYNNQTFPITMHWHGISQEGSQWYDGVPGVTQCTIAYKKSFTYIFQIKNQWGTFWYHSHVAQLRNTMHGALIIRPPVNNAEPLSVDIQGELLLMGGDWYQQSPSQLMDSISKPPYPGYPLPQALHINGKTLCTGIQYFTVKPNSWYRMRIINTAMWGSFNLKIDGHTMVVHEAEGGYLQHQTVSMLDVYPGQSYSVLIQTNKAPGNYWVVLNPRYDVEKGVQSRGLAVLTYTAKAVTPSPPNSPIPTGPLGADKNKAGPLFQSGLRSPYVNQQLRMAYVRKLIVLELNQNTLASGQQVYSMNNVSLTGGAMPFLLADYRGVGPQVYSSTLTPDLPPKGLGAQKDGPAKIAASVIPIPYGWWVQVVFQNHVPPGGLHPWHLHGYNFYVVAQGTGTFDPKKWLQYKYNLRNPPFRNTVAMFENTWVAIRFRATNPGQWILHCHLEQHADQGLETVFNVMWPTTPVTSRPAPLSPPPLDYPACPTK